MSPRDAGNTILSDMPDTIVEEAFGEAEKRGEKNFPPFAVSPELEKGADERISHYTESKRAAVMPLLHMVQHEFGFISPEAIDWVAGKLELEPIKVLEVVTFYPGFRQHAPGRYHVRVCRTLSCAMNGSAELMEGLCKEFGIDRDGSDSHHEPISISPCGKYSVEFAECLASCGTAPVCLVNDDFLEAADVDMVKNACRD